MRRYGSLININHSASYLQASFILGWEEKEETNGPFRSHCFQALYTFPSSTLKYHTVKGVLAKKVFFKKQRHFP